MSQQNLVSASIAADVKSDILAKLASIHSSLDFLVTLQTEEIKSLFKSGNAYAPFIELAYNTVSTHPGIMSGVFDAEEFKRDYILSKDLAQIATAIDQLADGVNNTLLAANSDALTAALEVYSAVKQQQDKVPGLNVLSAEMGVFFKRTRKIVASDTAKA